MRVFVLLISFFVLPPLEIMAQGRYNPSYVETIISTEIPENFPDISQIKIGMKFPDVLEILSKEKYKFREISAYSYNTNLKNNSTIEAYWPQTVFGIKESDDKTEAITAHFTSTATGGVAFFVGKEFRFKQQWDAPARDDLIKEIDRKYFRETSNISSALLGNKRLNHVINFFKKNVLPNNDNRACHIGSGAGLIAGATYGIPSTFPYGNENAKSCMNEYENKSLANFSIQIEEYRGHAGFVRGFTLSTVDWDLARRDKILIKNEGDRKARDIETRIQNPPVPKL